MRIPVTDQFLWDIFNATSKVEDALRSLIHPPKSFNHLALMVDDPVYQKYYKKLKPQKFSQLIYHLKRKNYIRVESLKGKQAVMFTRKGLGKVFHAQFKIDKGNKEKRSDGKWIMVIFDVPEKYKKSRELLRSILQNLGYKMFQQSAWITPYNVAEKTEMLFQEFSLDRFVRILLVEKMT